MQVAAAQARFLSPKQRFDVWLELATPEAHGQGGDELFQVRLLVSKGAGLQQECAQKSTLCMPGVW